MNYTFNGTTSTLNYNQKEGGFMPSGIHSNCLLFNYEYGLSKNGNEFIAFYFRNEANETLSHTEWIPKSDTPEGLEKKTINQLARIMQILTTYVDKKDCNINANDFKTFTTQVINLLDMNNAKSKKVRIKAVYTGNYITLPGNYGDKLMFQFIELMSTEKSKIKLVSNIDKVDRPIADTTTGTDNPFKSDSPF
jgi:hypothetical protein